MADLAAVQSVSKALCDCYNNGGRAELGDFYASDAKFMAHGLEKVVGRKGTIILFFLTNRITKSPPYKNAIFKLALWAWFI